MTQTTNYQLPQWSATDRVRRSDFNAAMSKIDTQMKANANNINTKAASSTVTSLQTTVNGKADKSTVTSLQTTVNNKADKSTVTNLQNTVTALQTTVNGKADASAVQTALAGKADASDLTALQTTVSGKADASDLAALQTTVNGKADASALAAIAAGLGTHGRNARIAWGSYVGAGTYGQSNPNTLTFDFCPVMVVILCYQTTSYQTDVHFLRGMPTARFQFSSSMYTLPLTWTDHSVSWYGITKGLQLNSDEYTYHYFAVGYDE